MLRTVIFIFFPNVHQIIASKHLWIQSTVGAVSSASWFCLQNVSISFFLKRTDDSVSSRREPQASSQLTPSAVTSIVLLTAAAMTEGNCHMHGNRKKIQERQDDWDKIILYPLSFSNKSLCYVCPCSSFRNLQIQFW